MFARQRLKTEARGEPNSGGPDGTVIVKGKEVDPRFLAYNANFGGGYLDEKGNFVPIKEPDSKLDDLKITSNSSTEAAKERILKQNLRDSGRLPPEVGRELPIKNTKINLAIAIWDWPTYFDPNLKLKGIKLNISKWQRPPQNSSPWDSKAAGLYMICTLSKHQAEKDGYTDSLMLDHEGNIAEATSANIFFKDKNNELHTPIPDSFLDGITRKTIIDLAKSKNIKINERKISPNELSNFTGCFITGTAAELTPVANILNNKFEVCSLIKDLSTSYEVLVGKNN